MGKAGTSNKAVESVADLLVELGCEELPPKSLHHLAHAFSEAVYKGLLAAGLPIDSSDISVFYTPRRLGFRLQGVHARQADQVQDRRGPAVEAAFDAAGQPTPAALGFARSVGLEVQALERQKTGNGEWLFCRLEKPGLALVDVLYPVLENALAGLPVARPMRWSNHDFSFVRPVHWLLVLHGSDILDGSLLGIRAGRETRGHRVHSPGPHPVDTAADYESVLQNAYVRVDPVQRRKHISALAVEAGRLSGGETRIKDVLLDEVTNIVEWPVAMDCSFEEDFLVVPPEALIASMEDHQKFFPVLNVDDGSLTAGFVVITNLESSDITVVRNGFERVIRARLADARFFWEQDRKIKLEDYAKALDGVIFQKYLGTVGDKSKRIGTIVLKLAEVTNIDPVLAQRAARLCKCDLITQMVGEFPQLQGTMGAYYAAASGEPEQVSQAIGEHYSPRFAGDEIPSSPMGQLLSVADRLDSLVGIFAAGLKPTGNKDPFALRRAALGIVRILTEANIAIPLDQLFTVARDSFDGQLTVSEESLAQARSFLLERYRNHVLEQGFNTNVINAVFAAPVTTLPDLKTRLEALAAFMDLPEAGSLVAANKRIGNILRKSKSTQTKKIDEDILVIDEEQRLFEEITKLEKTIRPFIAAANYHAALKALAGLDTVIAAFFDHVMVMDEDPRTRDNRLALLAKLKAMFDTVADLSLAT